MSVTYDAILMRDSCGKSRNKVKKYFYYNEYLEKSFKFHSKYDELILLDILEKTKKRNEYLKPLLPFIIIIALGALSWILWIVICRCTKNPKGCLKRNKVENKSLRSKCLIIFYGITSVVIILLAVVIMYWDFIKGDFYSAICTLSMLRYDLMNGEGLLLRKNTKRPYFIGVNNMPTYITSITTLLTKLRTSCYDYITNDLPRDSNGKHKYDTAGEALTRGLESLYTNYKDSKITFTNPLDTTQSDVVPEYILNLGTKENNETYLGKILLDYQTHYEYLVKNITDPILEKCEILQDGGTDLVDSLNDFYDVIKTMEQTVHSINEYITEYLAKYINSIENVVCTFFIIFFALMGFSIIALCILFSIYYNFPISSLHSSIIVVLYIINALMIFCLIFTGIFGIYSVYVSDISDIVDCVFSPENMNSVNPRLAEQIQDKDKIVRCFKGDGYLLDDYSNDGARKIIKSLTKIYFLYNQIKDSYEKINDNDENIYKTLNSIDQVMANFTEMKSNLALTTSPEEHGKNDINTMLNELNKYTIAGRKYQKVCDTTPTYHIWSIQKNKGVATKFDQKTSPIKNYYIEDFYTSTLNLPSYGTACPVDSGSSPAFNSVQEAFDKYLQAFKDYHNDNNDILDDLLTTDTNSLKNLNDDFKTEFIENMKMTLKLIKEDISDPVYLVFNDLLNSTYSNHFIQESENELASISWINCSTLGRDYNVTLNTIKTTFLHDLRVATYCSIISEALIITLYFFILSLLNNIRDKKFEKNEDDYGSKKDEHEIFEIIENNRFNGKYDYEGELITINKKNKKNNNKSMTTNDLTKDDMESVRKNLPKNIVNVPKFDVAENIEAIKNIDIRKRVDKNGKAVVHPVRIAINSPLGVMEASDKYADKYTYDVYESFHDDESKEGSENDNGSYYHKKDQKVDQKKNKKGGDKENEKDKKSKGNSEFSF